MQKQQKKPIAVLTVLSIIAFAGVIGCDFTRFDGLQDKSPAARIEKGGGTPFVGLVRQPASTNTHGGTLVLGSESIHAVLFNKDGGSSSSKIPGDKWSDDLQLDGHLIQSYAAAPVDKSEAAGEPLFYLGATAGSSGRVMIVGTGFKASVALPLGNVVVQNIDSFGIAMAPAALTRAGRVEDLVVGAKGGVVLLDGRTWPNFGVSELISIPNGASGGLYRALAAGELDHTSAENEIVVGADNRNLVAVMSNLKSCFNAAGGGKADADGGAALSDGGTDADVADAGVADSGQADQALQPDQGSSSGGCQLRTVTLEIPATQDGVVAQDFGFSVLIADVDNDNTNELVVGAPASEIDGAASDERSGAVYIYKLKDAFANLQGGKVQLVPFQLLKAPEGTTRFGSSLAFGRFDGGTRGLLAVGAPQTTVGKQLNAGRVLIHAPNSTDGKLEEIKALELATPSGEGDLLGLNLTVMPFFDGDRLRDVLVASANKSALVFFANVTEDHKDFRKTE